MSEGAASAKGAGSTGEVAAERRIEIVRLERGPLEVELVPQLGARLHRVRAFGHDLLRTPATPDLHASDPFFWGGYVMAPWCNRVDATATVVGGRRVRLPANFPDGSAIHGQVYARPWERTGAGSFRVSGGDDGWPWAYEVTLDAAVEAAGTNGAALHLRLAVTNRSDEPMPAGIGLHPWFVEPVRVRIAADRVFPGNVESPARPVAVSGPYDLREPARLGPGVDATWSDLHDPPVRLAWPSTGVTAEMALRAPTRYVCAAGAAQLGAVAVEPQTHAPQGIRRLLRGEPGGLAWLAPAESVALEIDLSFVRG
jgi:aldose 1-epimerase